METKSQLIESFDRLIEPLNQILVMMKKTLIAQRIITIQSILVLLGVIGAAYFQLGLLNRLENLEAKIGGIISTSYESNTVAKETQKKVNETGEKIEKIEEIQKTDKIITIQVEPDKKPFIVKRPK